MAAPKNFVAGFNHNIKHRGQVFHVQTEDSGEEIAVISTHLFVGGTILATRRQSYDELRGVPELQKSVRARMEEQHKQVLRDLVNGQFEERLKGVRSYQPGEIVDAAPSTPPASITRFDRNGAAPPARPLGPTPGPDRHVPLATTPGPARPLQAAALAVTPGPARPAPTSEPTRPPAPAASKPPPPPVEIDLELEIDLADLPLPSLPPAPAAPRPLQALPVTPGPARPITAIEPPPDLRTPGPGRALAPAFGASVISERSLDQVILAYLSGDQDE